MLLRFLSRAHRSHQKDVDPSDRALGSQTLSFFSALKFCFFFCLFVFLRLYSDTTAAFIKHLIQQPEQSKELDNTWLLQNHEMELTVSPNTSQIPGFQD